MLPNLPNQPIGVIQRQVVTGTGMEYQLSGQMGAEVFTRATVHQPIPFAGDHQRLGAGQALRFKAGCCVQLAQQVGYAGGFVLAKAAPLHQNLVTNRLVGCCRQNGLLYGLTGSPADNGGGQLEQGGDIDTPVKGG